ncbi:hypothetical protein [Bacteroides sp. 224]|uniref:hypothetical protein n=1 Tax=Bacteroides sp. 224 TaxID=2302936 RepID=UPI0013D6C19A|nr:hypothetical protein [Bacteroides sp. 224]NDV64484.1 hypothetical protein [Bacteroides sp. 224]
MMQTKSDLLKNIGMIALLIALITGSILAYRRESRIKPCEYENDPVLRVLFPKGKPIGQAFSRFQPDKRMVRVDSYQEAYEISLSMCVDNKQVVPALPEFPHTCYLYPLCGKDGYLCFTDKAELNTYEVAVIWVMSDSISKLGIREIRFVEMRKKE